MTAPVPTPLNVAILGVTGWIGRPLADAIEAETDLRLAAGVSRTAAGADLGQLVTGTPSGIGVYATVEEALDSGEIDVVVDYTSPSAVLAHALTALESGSSVVIGTSGLDAADFDRIDEAARAHELGAFAAGNFSVLLAVLEHAALLAVRTAEGWEVIDYGSAGKPDAPSGTARQIAERLSAVARPRGSVAVPDTIGLPEARGADLNGTQVHSLRLPSFTLSTEVVLGSTHERLSLRHDADATPDPYLDGTLLAVRRVGTWTGLVRGLDQLLFGAANP